MELRILQSSEQPALERFLRAHTDSSMILLGNARSVGVIDHGQRHEGTYAGAIEGERVRGVVAHYYNGMLVAQAPVALISELARLATRISGRQVNGLLGPADQVAAMRASLGLGTKATTTDKPEGLYALQLDALRLPEAATAPATEARVVVPSDADPLVRWSVDYAVEALGARPDSELEARCRDSFARRCADGSGVVLLRDGAPVACCALTTRLPEAVEIGGVYTPPELRARGYGRAVVAHALRLARDAGSERGVLFTDDHNLSALRAYLAIGFERVGDFGLVLFE